MTEEAVLGWLAERWTRLVALADAHPVALDLIVGPLIVAASCWYLDGEGRLGIRAVIFAVALCAPLTARRRWPELACGAVLTVGLAQWLLSVPQPADIAILIALYTVAERAPAISVLAAALAVEAGTTAACATWAVFEPVKIWIGLSGLTVAAAGLGIVVRQRRELLASLRERAARLELERDGQVRLAAAAERARIAREMHDVVSHNVAVMVALADGASYARDAAPEQARPTLGRISTTGREALGEMRRLLGVLTDAPGDGPLEPQPSLARLDELVGRVEAAGIPVAVNVDGDPQRLSEGVQLAVFRVAQEALTNTLKHAVEPTGATVTLRCDPAGEVELEVCDDGRRFAGVGPAGADATGSGRGLAGMRERAAAYDGQLDAGPGSDGGWRVRLALHA